MARSIFRAVAALGLAASLLHGAPALSQGNQVFGIGAPASISELPPGAFRDSLLALPPQERGRALATLQGLVTPSADFEFMRVDRRGGIFYVDPAPDELIQDQSQASLAEPITEAGVFSLHSKPGAPTVLYVDFDGHDLIGTVWNNYSGQPVLHMLPYDLDGVPSTFSQSELNRIAESWRRVAEDFAAFDVDVTTEEPPFTTDPTTGRIQYASNVGHNLVTRQQDASGYWVYTQGGCGCGGVAYVGVFGSSYYQPGLTFNASLGSNALTISHETGHNLGLSHDGTSSSGYYSGHGSGETSWGPIMGAPFGKSLTTWSRGEYPGANNTQDDYAVIANYLPLRTDDHEDVNLGAATPLMVSDSVNVLSTTRVTDPGWSDLANKGIIEDPNDFDLFAMSVGTGTIALSIDPARVETYEGSQGANLDIQARLLDSVGTVLQTSNPDLSVGADINYPVSVPGEYYLEVTGVGRAGTGGGDYGHSDYASIGQFYIRGTVPADTVVVYPPSAPTNLQAAVSGGANIELSWTDEPATPPEANEAGYRIFRSVDGGGFDLLATLPRDSEFYADNNLANGQYSYYLQVYNSAGHDETAPTDPIDISAPVVAVATSESSALGSVASGSYLDTRAVAGSETLSEQHSGGRPTRRQSYLDHSWVVSGVVPAALVELEVRASAPANTESDNFAFRYSLDGGANWDPLGTLFAGGSETFTAMLPPVTSGSVLVRVQDTDSSVGAGNTDTVTVSLIRVTSTGDLADQPPIVTITEPANGITVPGGTALVFSATAEDFEDGDISDKIAWSVDGGPTSLGASTVMTLSGGTSAVTHVITAEATDSAKHTATDSITVTVDDAASGPYLAVADLQGAASPNGKGGNWSAAVTVLVNNDLGAPVSGATVNGTWSGDASGSGSCVTDGGGLCGIGQGGMKRNDTVAIFTVDGVTGSAPYDASHNAVTSVSIGAPAGAAPNSGRTAAAR